MARRKKAEVVKTKVQEVVKEGLVETVEAEISVSSLKASSPESVEEKNQLVDQSTYVLEATIGENSGFEESTESDKKRLKVNPDISREKESTIDEKNSSSHDPAAISTFRFGKDNHAVYQDEHMLIGLRDNEKICFAGAIYVTAIMGSFSVMGYNFSSPVRKIKSNHIQPVLDTNEIRDTESEYFDLNTVPLKRYPCFSSRTHSLLTIENQNIDSSEIIEESESQKNPAFVSLASFHNLNQSTLSKKAFPTLEDYGNHELRLIVQDLMSTVLKAAQKGGHKPFSSFLLLSTIPPNKYLSSSVLISEKKSLFSLKTSRKLPGFYPVLKPTAGETALEISSSWIESMEEFAEDSKPYVRDDTNSPVIGVVCGRKNTGKSTFAKVLTNRLLKHFPAVAFINCDIGQTEFTPPGMLALHFITEPVLGPSFTQLRPPAAACYVGDVQVKYESDQYISAIEHFLSLVVNRNHPFFQTPGITNVPIVINTLGWISGHGLELFTKLLKISKPTHIFQLGEVDIKLNSDPFSNLDQTNLESHGDLEDAGRSSDQDNFELMSCQIKRLPAISQSFDFVTTFSGFSSVRLRLLAFSAYFNNTSSPSDSLDVSQKGHFFTPLVSQVPYSVPWKHFELWFLQGDLDVSQVLFAFNGAIVGLCESTHQVRSSNECQGISPPNLVKPSLAPYPPPSHYNCLGLGIIRGIDPAQGKFHILTPLPYSQLTKITALVKGELNVPVNHLTNEVQTTDNWSNINLPDIDNNRLAHINSHPYLSLDMA